MIFCRENVLQFSAALGQAPGAFAANDGNPNEVYGAKAKRCGKLHNVFATKAISARIIYDARTAKVACSPIY